MKSKKYPVKIICSALNLKRSTLYYRPKKEILFSSNTIETEVKEKLKNIKNSLSLNKFTEAELVEKIKDIAYKYPFYGYRRIYKTLKKEIEGKGLAPINIKKVYRIYRQLSLTRNKGTKKTRKINEPKKGVTERLLLKPMYPSHIWAMDFSFIRITRGIVKILSVEDLYSRKLLYIYADFSITSYDIQDILINLFSLYNKPKIIRTDNGPEFRSKMLNILLQKERIHHEFIPPGKPFYNGHKERNIRTIKEECLWMNEFENLKESRDTLEKYKEFYNKERPRSSLCDKTPDEIFYQKDNENY